MMFTLGGNPASGYVLYDPEGRNVARIARLWIAIRLRNHHNALRERGYKIVY